MYTLLLPNHTYSKPCSQGHASRQHTLRALRLREPHCCLSAGTLCNRAHCFQAQLPHFDFVYVGKLPPAAHPVPKVLVSTAGAVGG